MSHVLIVGAGPAGASLAFLLASRGIDTTLVERQPDFEREFRGEGLLPSGLAAIREMRLLDAVEQLPRHVIDRVEILLDGRPLFELDVRAERFGGLAPCVLSQPAFLERVVNEAAQFACFRFEPASAVVGVLQKGERIAGVRVRTGTSERDVYAELVVAADGRASTVRKRAGLEPPRSRDAFDVVWFKTQVPADVLPTGRIRFYLGSGQFAVAFPSYDGRLQIGWVISKGTFGKLHSRDSAEWLDRVATHLDEELGSYLRQYRGDLPRAVLLSVVSNRVKSWTRPGLLLLGDAAHPMSPIGAQGVNIALCDAIAAANELTPVLSRDSTVSQIDAACMKISRTRAPVVAAVQRLQALPARLLLGRSVVTRGTIALLPALTRLGVLPLVYGLALRRLALGRPVKLRV